MATAVKLDEKKLELHFRSCRDAGMPRDQVELLTTAAYCPTPKQQEFHAAARACDDPGGPVVLLFGGARAGGKTHCVYSQAGHDDCQRYPGLKVLFLRIIQKHARESFDDLIRRTMTCQPHKTSQGMIQFPNGSRIIYGGCRTAQDVEGYVGQEYDLIIVEELTQFPQDTIDMVLGSLRTSRTDDWRPRAYFTTNPGGVGHEWVKQQFVIPYRMKQEQETRFIPALSTDNPHVNPEYQKYLDGLTGIRRAMWRDGDWDIQEGRAFPSFGADNVITLEEYREMVSTGTWVHYRGIDFGTRNPYCCVWLAFNPVLGRVINYREHYKAGITAGEQADLINQFTLPDEQISVNFCDPAMFIKNSTDYQLQSVADIYSAHGILLTKGNNNRIAGKYKVDNLLATKPDGQTGLLVTENCEHLISQLYDLVYAKKNKEDVDTEMEDHAYDAFRYGISAVRDYTIVEPSKQQRQPNPWLELFPN